MKVSDTPRARGEVGRSQGFEKVVIPRPPEDARRRPTWTRRGWYSRVFIAPRMESMRVTVPHAANLSASAPCRAYAARGPEGRSSGTRENRVECAPHRGSSHPWRTCAWGRRCACGGWKRVVIALRTRVHELIDPNDARTRLRDPRNAPRRGVPGRGRGRDSLTPAREAAAQPSRSSWTWRRKRATLPRREVKNQRGWVETD